MARLTYKFRLYPSACQKKKIEQHIFAVRFLYNRLIEDRTAFYRKMKQWKKLDVKPFIDEQKWNMLDQRALKGAENSVRIAYRYFFNISRDELRYRKESIEKNANDPTYELLDSDAEFYPRIKTKKTRESYSTSKNVRLLEKHAYLPCVGSVRAVFHRQIPENAKILYYTVLRNPSDEYYLLVHFEVPDEEKKDQIKTILGVALTPGKLAVRSDDVSVDFRHISEKQQKQIDKAYQTLCRRVPGSKRYEKQRKRLAALYEHRANQRRDDLYKTVQNITDSCDMIMAETPNVRQRQGALKRLGEYEIVLDEAWYLFIKMLQNKANQKGLLFFRVPQIIPIYKRCSACGSMTAGHTRDKNLWICPECGAELPLSKNAAYNLEKSGERYIGLFDNPNS